MRRRRRASPGGGCPTAGTEITFDTGNVLTFHAPHPLEPDVCPVTTLAGPQRWLFNFYYLPMVDEAGVRARFGALWPLRIGNGASLFTYSTRWDGAVIAIRETWRVERTETPTIAGRPNQTFVITRMQQATEGNRFLGRQTFWYDTETRTWVKRTIEVFRDSSPEAAFEAVRIRRPR